MMQCLESRGMDCAYDPNHCPIDKKFNPGGFYEEAHQPMGFFKHEKYKDRVVKVKYSQVKEIDDEDYRVIMLTRDWEDIKKSQERAFGGALEYCRSEENYAKWCQDMWQTLSSKKYTEYIVMPYEVMRDEPETGLDIIADLGWPCERTIH